MTIEYAQNELKNSAKLTDELCMTVYTLFQQDMITNEVYMSRAMFSSAIEGQIWFDNKVKLLKQLKVPFAIYLYDTLEMSTGNLEFNDNDMNF